MPHEVDSLGYPVDPELNQLESHLGDLAARWRGASTVQSQEPITAEYHATMARLYELGWDGRLDIDRELPDSHLPEEYLQRNPRSPEITYWGEVNEYYKRKPKGRDKKTSPIIQYLRNKLNLWLRK